MSPQDVSPRPVPKLIHWLVGSFQRFSQMQSAGGIVLVAMTVVAMVWANSRFAGSHHTLFATPLGIEFAGHRFAWPLSLWVNDVLMTIFFLVVGMEIKHELVLGELRTLRRAMLPLISAAGGMLIPAGIYALINRGQPGLGGWGIPTATDIAFALGCLSILGKRVPPSLSVFLAALAIFDDLGAILLIAIFYGGSIQLTALVAAAFVVVVLLVLNRLRVQSPWLYALGGVALWLALHEAGLHPTLAGVVLGLAIPARPLTEPSATLTEIEGSLGALKQAVASDSDDGHGALASLERHLEAMQAPLDRLLHGLQPWVAFGIVPLFALTNAGVVLDLSSSSQLPGATEVALGAALGLILGKSVGVFSATFLAVKMKLCPLPAGATWFQVFGVAVLAGIGFTMSVFITQLAFSEGSPFINAAKLGIIAGSLFCAITGSALLMLAARKQADVRGES